jgi:hypothetical protein
MSRAGFEPAPLLERQMLYRLIVYRRLRRLMILVPGEFFGLLPITQSLRFRDAAINFPTARRRRVIPKTGSYFLRRM